ncbi:unnamed protein product [Didymodactylos carnosus]|uniref:Cytochrome c oxidase assembly protein COX15 n=1 Tax=Didymodactylos carnosus TaxID=1234261 RepID=A0A814BJ14_9BILA|nr:unnamed protein product [Didymodactylos carnosus]CAF1314350.1 unnamed protein product [Didymodactylos carnosus]CAF3705991.1 unnamed protein product [Didymodactylos carnosus]CAF4122998.1 unnamed protein product [Didymodactylos carnosus]
MTAGAVLLGGLTRLTESGLSMTDWRLIRDMKPPRTQEEWDKEFERYKQFPEYQLINRRITLNEFKRIYYMEYLHRMWGRLTGLVFFIPAVYFWQRRYFDKGLKIRSIVFGALIGFQGALGWYMVKSGLKNETLIDNYPRVSPYRLAAHLGTAFILYSGFLWNSFRYLFPSERQVVSKIWGMRVHGLLTLVFITAVAGAFVAGLDAGLVYNTFPKMGDHWIPVEYNHLKPWYKNLFENPAAVQFNHRVLGITTTAAVMAFAFMSRGKGFGRRAAMARNLVAAMVLIQATLGISTVLYYVPTSLAASHQMGSLTLLSLTLWLAYEMRRLPKV